MTEKKKRVPTSLRVIEEMYESAKENCMKTHHRADEYGRTGSNYNTTQEKADLDSKKAQIIKKLSQTIEEEAIKKYGKDYGLISVPVCHRSSSSGEDRLAVDLKVKKFPGCEKESEAFEKECQSYEDDMKKIDAWKMEALQAIAKKEELPALPDLSK